MESRRLATFMGVLGALALGSCGGENKAAAPAPKTPSLMTGTISRVAPSVSVSEDLARACKLQLADSASTPKFDFDRSDLSTADREVLAKLATCLTTGPLHGRSVQLIGRADARGESQYNMVLGAHRASGVADVLANLGLPRGQLSTTSRGELDALGSDETGYREDRRVDIMLTQ